MLAHASPAGHLPAQAAGSLPAGSVGGTRSLGRMSAAALHMTTSAGGCRSWYSIWTPATGAPDCPARDRRLGHANAAAYPPQMPTRMERVPSGTAVVPMTAAAAEAAPSAAEAASDHKPLTCDVAVPPRTIVPGTAWPLGAIQRELVQAGHGQQPATRLASNVEKQQGSEHAGNRQQPGCCGHTVAVAPTRRQRRQRPPARSPLGPCVSHKRKEGREYAGPENTGVPGDRSIRT